MTSKYLKKSNLPMNIRMEYFRQEMYHRRLQWITLWNHNIQLEYSPFITLQDLKKERKRKKITHGVSGGPLTHPVLAKDWSKYPQNRPKKYKTTKIYLTHSSGRGRCRRPPPPGCSSAPSSVWRPWRGAEAKKKLQFSPCFTFYFPFNFLIS